MTVGEAIAQAKHLRHAAMNDDGTTYYRWLTEVEQEIVEHLNRHVDPEYTPGTASGFDPLNLGHPPDDGDLADWLDPDDYVYTSEDTAEEMILPVRWEMIYVLKLMCEIDMTVGETEQYNKDATLYNQMMDEWKAWVRRTMTPKQDHRRSWALV